jgi:hypothetical protein
MLESAVEKDEKNGNVLVHGSCPADILVYFDSDAATPATGDQIAELRAIGIYV